MRLKKYHLFLFIVLVGAFFRFYKLDWGNGFFFHPDEYHIAASVRQMSFPDQMHPNFFAYGTFISYLIYFTKEAAVWIGIIDSSLNPILVGRFLSAVFSTALLPIIYLITNRLTKDEATALLATALTAFSPGLIQQAHFTTPESILIFWIFTSILFTFNWVDKGRIKYLLLTGLSFGSAISVKISGLIFTPVFIFALLVNERPYLKNLRRMFILPIVFLTVSLLIYLIIYPYSLIDFEAFRHSMRYETGVGRGDPIVFYTRQFIDTKPIIFQITRILPYVLDPLTLITGLIGSVIISYQLIKSRFAEKKLLVFLSAFLLFFSTSSFLFAKWTRFIIPVLPFLTVFAALAAGNIKRDKFKIIISIGILLSSIVWSAMFFRIYLNQDVRLRANEWLSQNLEAYSFVLTESGNMIEVPISTSLTKYSFDFYNLENSQSLKSQLPQLLAQADYFIIQGRRIYYNHGRLPNRFPTTSSFYDNLFSGELGFKHIKTFTSYPGIDLFGIELKIEDEYAEETWSVFDHPVIRVYKKTQNLSANEYEEILQI